MQLVCVTTLPGGKPWSFPELNSISLIEIQSLSIHFTTLFAEIIKNLFNLHSSKKKRKWVFKDLHKWPFKYYVIIFLTFLGPSTSLMIYRTVNHQKLPFSDPTHPPLWWRNTWMVPNQNMICSVLTECAEMCNTNFHT